LQNAAAFCDVKSWLTKRRLVSLPFSDYCDLLVEDGARVNKFVSALWAGLSGNQIAYIELRLAAELHTAAAGSRQVYRYCGHQLDLTPELSTLFKNFHHSSTQRKIRRAEREGLTYREGRSPFLLNCFYDLLILTRRRHGAPPQPVKWFRALIDSMGENLQIRVAFRNSQPIAAMMTLRHKDTLLSKYVCSDARFHNLGGVHLLYWKSIVGAKEDGMRVFDFGRTDWKNAGLITFKDRWGAQRALLNYLRLSASGAFPVPPDPDWIERTAKGVLSRLPARLLRVAGELIYPHIG
jgi:CelD/BcsL family acetyltransferase involved in cellulose biosynthesis